MVFEFKETKDIISFLVLLLVGGLIHIALPLFALTAGRGGEEALKLLTSSIYFSLFIIGIVLIGAMKVGQFLSKKDKKTDRKIGWMGTYIHDPEKAILPQIKGFRWLQSPLKTLLIGIPLITLIALPFSIQNTFFTSIPEIEFQQITEIGETILAVEPAGAEIWLPQVLFLGLPISLYFWLFRRKKISKEILYLLTFLTALIVYPLAWMLLHFLIYGGSETALGFAFLFGLVTALFTVLSGTIIFAWLLKDISNLLRFLTTKFDPTAVLVVVLLILLIYALIAGSILFRTRKKKSEFTEKPIAEI